VKATRHKLKLVVNFTFICNNIPAAPAYGVYISQLMRYSRTCGSYHDFLHIGLQLTRKLLKQGFPIAKLKIPRSPTSAIYFASVYKIFRLYLGTTHDCMVFFFYFIVSVNMSFKDLSNIRHRSMWISWVYYKGYSYRRKNKRLVKSGMPNQIQ
jgi:hypothetical protein